MELYAKGQLSFLILTCMQERDFYGLDIISEISEKSNGRINLKKPSVYSNLTRMEKQGYISSYLKSSDLGPNRKYYSLTEKGREFYQELKEYFDRNNIDVFKAFDDGQSPVASNENFLQEEVAISLEDTKAADTINEDESEDDFFDFSFSNEESHEEQAQVEEEKSIEERAIIQQITPVQQAHPAPTQPAYAFSIKHALTQQQEEVEPADNQIGQKADDGVFLSQQTADEYNKKLYDISKDINKYRKRRSFAEDQISMAATDPLASSQDKKQSNIEEFKNALMQNKTKYQDQQRLSQDDFMRQIGGYRTEHKAFAETAQKEELKNDAVYITNRIDEREVEKAKKIEPPRLQIISENVKETRLPAPKRDVTIDPSHKERLIQLYSKTRDQSSAEFREDAIYDYSDLKDYYNSQDLPFNVYQKPTRKLRHNTNKLYMVVSIIALLLAVALSAVTYVVINANGLLDAGTEFLYYVLPALFIFDVVYRIYKLKKSRGWLPKQMLPQWAIWLLFILFCGVVVALNFIAGAIFIDFKLQTTTLVLPFVMGVVAIPMRYYIKRIAIVKYWR
ncbi:MAG: helix-turn-helix transcriptional regulator [Clostridia bacterium]|nr:helix-turn-helix transcriptional regulator [Clostridia bacterium]